MYTLIGNPKNRAFRVLWMLEELGVDYDLIPASPRSEELAAVNPSAKSPVLKVGDDHIIDSAAILQYLADKHGRFTAAAGTIERAHQDSMLFFALDELDATLWQAAKHKFILPEELRTDAVRPALEHDFHNAMRVLETRLGDRTYATGDEFTVPDIVIGHCSGWAINARFGWPDGPLKAYSKRLRERPAYMRAHEIRLAN
ncbi:MAG: glutathione S-transferase family protein [Nitratireductor sp.]|nr:glutathione S-transferase family protein [Nitratireductor sp.]